MLITVSAESSVSCALHRVLGREGGREKKCDMGKKRLGTRDTLLPERDHVALLTRLLLEVS